MPIVDYEMKLTAIRIDGKRIVMEPRLASLFRLLKGGDCHWSEIHSDPVCARIAISDLRRHLRGTPFWIDTKFGEGIYRIRSVTSK